MSGTDYYATKLTALKELKDKLEPFSGEADSIQNDFIDRQIIKGWWNGSGGRVSA
jgi:hypothetical protein